MDARSGVIAGDLHLEETKFDGQHNSSVCVCVCVCVCVRV